MEDVVNIINILSCSLAIILFFSSVLAVLIGKIVYGISIFQPIEEIAYKQEKYRKEHELQKFKNRMVIRNLELGNSFLDIYHLKDAKNEFEKALHLDPTNVEAHMGLIKSEVFKPILEEDPSHYDPEIAEKKLNLILKENPNDKHALAFLGRIYIEIDTEVALEYLNKAVSIDPKFGVVYCAIAYAYTKQNNTDAALTTMKTAKAVSKWNPNTINNMGYQYFIQKQYEKAIEQFEFLLKFYPHLLVAYWNVSNAYMMKGDFKRAYEYQLKSIDVVENEDCMSQRLNSKNFFFRTEHDNEANFSDLIEKKCYSYYCMALICYLLDYKDDTQKYIGKAQKLCMCDKTSTKNLLSFTIISLQKKDSTLINKLDLFKESLSDLGFNDKDKMSNVV